jgi:hypothetical protein
MTGKVPPKAEIHAPYFDSFPVSREMVARNHYSVFGIIPANGLVLYGYQRVWVLLGWNHKWCHSRQTDRMIVKKKNYEN